MPLASSPVPRDFDTTTATAQRLPRAHQLRALYRSWDIDARGRILCGAALLVVAWLAAALFGYASVVVYRAAHGVARDETSLALVGLTSAFVALVGAAAWLTGRVATAEEWWMPMRALASEFDGWTSSDPARRRLWIDRYWIGDLLPLDLHRSHHGGSVTLVTRGYPVLVVFDPLRFQAREARVELFLAATTPALHLPRNGNVALEACEWFARHGFELRWSDAGLRATATAALVAALDELADDCGERVEAATDALVAIVHALATTAALLDAEPVPPEGLSLEPPLQPSTGLELSPPVRT